MKIVLVILCLIMVLFAGGCAILAIGYVGPLGLIPLGVVVLNCLVLAVLFGWAKAAPVAFYTLAVLDFIVAIGAPIAAVGLGGSDPTIFPWALLLTGGFALKGGLTWAYVRRSPS